MVEKRKRRFLDRQVPLWAVGLVVNFMILGAIAFGNIAVYTSAGGTKVGVIGDGVLGLSTLQDKVERAFFNADNYLRIENDHHDFTSTGFTFNYSAETRPEAGYLLLSRWNEDAKRGAVELWDMNSQELKHSWEPEVNKINRLANLEANGVNLVVDSRQNRFVFRHPLVLEDGSLIYKARTPLVRVDACNELVFQNDQDIFHHSTELDSEGYFWVPTRMEPTNIPRVDQETFLDDAITRVNQEGQIVFQRSVSDLFLKYGMEHYVYGRAQYTDNPIHLNDIQPVETDGKFWKKGDVFLSLRSHSIVLLYRPSTDEIIWFKEGPWSHQHDVDILDDHRISVFNNDSIEGVHFRRTISHSNVMIFDFETEEVSAPWDDVLARMDFKSETEGLHTIMPDGSLFLEEQNSGRIVMLNPSKEIDWQFVNRASNDEIYSVAWSRMLDRELGDRIVASVENANCAL